MNSQRQSLRLAATLSLFSILLTACGNMWGSYDPYPTLDSGISRTETYSPFSVTATALSVSAQPSLTSTPTATRFAPSEQITTPRPSFFYEAQSGDSLDVVAVHFGVQPDEIASSGPLPDSGFITPGTILVIPNRLSDVTTTPGVKLLPDSEVVYGPGAVDFDIDDYISEKGGFLSTFREYLAVPGWITGAGSIERLAFESSINPRILLAYLQYKSGWVLGEPIPGTDEHYPLGYYNPFYQGLYQELRLMVQDLDAGYYGWRAGSLTDLTFLDGTSVRIAPNLNAGTVALLYLFSQYMDYDTWLQAIEPQGNFLALYTEMFGDPWAQATLVEPLYPPGLVQPGFSFPFEPEVPWTFTGGPHPAWEKESALAALDFAPPSSASGCVESAAWVVALAPGRIVRSGGGYVVLDLDGDGYEQTGWVVLYLHIATNHRIPAGTWVDAGDHIGHPSCEGGVAIGTHVHIARKYNGEWVGAGGALPFVLSGWTTHQGDLPRYGTLTKGEQTIFSSPVSSGESLIIRQPGE